MSLFCKVGNCTKKGSVLKAQRYIVVESVSSKPRHDFAGGYGGLFAPKYQDTDIPEQRREERIVYELSIYQSCSSVICDMRTVNATEEESLNYTRVSLRSKLRESA